MEQSKIWFNKPQLASILSLCKEEYGVWGRATGKTQGPLAYRSSYAANTMPRGATGIVGATYTQLLENTLQPLIKSWAKWGYIENKHFWVRKFPPAKFNIPSAIYKVMEPQHTIFWWNGHVFHLISQDRPGLANGKNLDAIIADECRFLNHERYMSDIAPTNRGNLEYFGHLPHHHMVTMYTDMPTSPKGKWILEKEKQMDKGLVNDIITMQLAYNETLGLLKEGKGSKEYLTQKLNNQKLFLDENRKNSVYYSEASTLDNIQILGTDQIRQWRRELLWPVFQASVLNKRVVHTDNGFYSLFDEHRHTYVSANDRYIDSLPSNLPDGIAKNSKKDGDVIVNKPLDIAFDYGSHINCVVVAQDQRNFYRILNGLYVKGDKRLNDLIDNFVAYYAHHQNKTVNYFYDHTAQVTDTTRVTRVSDEVIKAFNKAGWKVNAINIGQQPRHETRYRLFQNVFAEKDVAKYKPIRMNAENCKELIMSIQQAGVIQGKSGFEKDKRSEKNSSFAQEEATHFTDALDTLYVGKFKQDYGIAKADLSVVFSG